LFHRDLVYGLEDAHAGIVHQDVEAAEPFRGGGDQSATVFVAADVGGETVRAPAIVPKLFDRRLDAPSVAPANKEARTLPNQRPGNTPSDAPRAARNDSHLVLKFRCHTKLPPVNVMEENRGAARAARSGQR